jgi:hypothetical protein
MNWISSKLVRDFDSVVFSRSKQGLIGLKEELKFLKKIEDVPVIHQNSKKFLTLLNALGPL